MLDAIPFAVDVVRSNSASDHTKFNAAEFLGSMAWVESESQAAVLATGVGEELESLAERLGLALSESFVAALHPAALNPAPASYSSESDEDDTSSDEDDVEQGAADEAETEQVQSQLAAATLQPGRDQAESSGSK